jgi:flagellar basal-body rod protein FlgG
MMRALYTAATGMNAQEVKMQVTANNLANASTTGFKKTRAEFEDLLVETLRPAQAGEGGRPIPLEVGLGVRAAGTSRTFSQGDLIGTQNPLDVAIQGDGFLPVRQLDGTLALSRAGNLRIDATGQLVTQQGLAIEPGLTIPNDATNVTITEAGQVRATVPGRATPVEVGTIELAISENPGGLSAVGGNLYLPTEASGRTTMVTPGEGGAGTLLQGFVEGSNVTTVEEMIDLITTQRAYEMNSKVIQTADQMLQKLTNLR